VTLVATAPSTRQTAAAIAVAICCGDGALRGRLEQLVDDDASFGVVGAVGDPAALDRLLAQHRIDVALVQSPAVEHMLRWARRYREIAFVAIVDDAPDGGMAVLRAGARAVLSHAAADADVAITMKGAARGLCVLPGEVLRTIQSTGPIVEDSLRLAGEGPLTARELEVLAAMADGASNKVIARRLGISFHTAKFHVAGILAKLDADSRTEAVTKAAALGLVML
jgi:DNA-binding NarL/FixJ family response regulator